MDQASHIFIVGIPRSGTTLVRQVLNMAPEVAICPETHFFGSANFKSFLGPLSTVGRSVVKGNKMGLRQKIAPIDWTTDVGADEVVDLMYGLDRAYSRWLKSHITADTMRGVVLGTAPTDRAFFDTMMAIYASDKPIRGEKTPAHLFFVPTLMEWFPHSKVVHILRDPRAVYVSHKKRWKSETGRSPYHQMQHSDFSLLLHITQTWLRACKIDRIYAEQYSNNYFSCRFEEITRSPRKYLQIICDFIGIKLRDAMLEPEVLNSGFVSQTNKNVGFDTLANVRWREHIHPITNLWFTFWMKVCRQNDLY